MAPALTADGMLLRAWVPGDAPAVLAMSKDPQARAWSGSMQRIHGQQDARDWVDRRGTSGTEWAVCDAATGVVVGRVGLHAVHLEDRVAEVGYSVTAQRRRQGLATKAIEAVTAYGFRTLGLARISLVHAVGNPASCAAARRAGYGYEGVERSAIDHGDGVRHAVHRHARLAGDPPGPVDPAPAPLRPVELRAGDLVLRPWRPEDAPEVLVALSDPLVVRWNPRLPLRGLDEARAWLAGRAARWADGRAATWAVVARGGTLLGSVSLRELDRADAFAVTSYWTVPVARGRGVAGLALLRATSYAFEELGLHRVQLAHAVANVASCRVAEKAGFVLEGTMRESNRLIEGLSDEHLHARLAGDPRPSGFA